jgi:mannose-6-phosphate isomerase-like protein (cupin superfamily)
MSLAEAEEFLRSKTYPIVPLGPGFVDERGRITNLTTKGATSVAVLTSKAGSSRASHVHKTDDHLSYVISGRVEYWWEEGVINADGVFERVIGTKRKVVVEAGQAFYTPPWTAHTMFFPVDTVFATISCQSREHADHEADLIRVASLKAE